MNGTRMSKNVIILDAAGKRKAWNAYLARSGKEGVVVVTSGQVCAFPPRLFPIGISFGEEKIDFGRVTDEAKRDQIKEALAEAGPSGCVYIATDKDVEGDAIALDVLNIIAESASHLLMRSYRAHPKSLTPADISDSIETALPVMQNYQRIVDAAVEGRARSVTDRWIGAALSRAADTPIGRVRSAIPGMVLLHQTRPSSLRGPVEVGETVFTARSATGGLPFRVRVALMSDDPPERRARLTNIARRFSNRLIPGAVMPVVSLSAAVADRFMNVRPHNTGDAVAHAARHYGVRPHLAMQGLLRAYYRGDVSYPRTDSRTLTPQSAAKVARLGASCEVYGLSASDAVEMDRSERVHEALHPVCEASLTHVKRLREILRKDWVSAFAALPAGAEPDPEMMADLMTAIVTRRAFESAKAAKSERGFWRPGNDLMSTALSHEDFDLLEHLEWDRELGPVLPWTRHMTTGARVWPRESVLMDMMMTEELGRPSSLPSLLKTVVAAGDIDVSDDPDPFSGPDPFRLPTLTAQGRENLRKMPRTIWDPATGRSIARALANSDGESNETPKDHIDARIRKRVALWLGKMDAAVRDPLLAAIPE